MSRSNMPNDWPCRNKWDSDYYCN